MQTAQGAPRTLSSYGPNAVSIWNEIATNTINVAPAATGTPEERRPVYTNDLATVHVAIYDAVIAIAGTHKPFATTPTTPAAGASMDAAAGAAAYGVLRALFPSRGALYQGAYDSFVAAIPDGEAKSRGLTLGAEVAAATVALRANDGRSVVLPPYVPGTEPGQFRGTNPVNTYAPYIRPFVMTSTAQFRPDGPNALTSAEYAADVNETRDWGGATSSLRSAAQTELARFHTEPPPRFWPRNLRWFMTTSPELAENARLAALIWVAQSDALNACFEAKYHYQFWRPFSAIRLADTDGNPATSADPTWTPTVPTPNHPEYPAAHGCGSGAAAESLRQFYGTKKINFQIDSTVTGTVRHYDSTDAMVDDAQMARIFGGMHFRTSTVHGIVLGTKAAKLVARERFGGRD